MFLAEYAVKNIYSVSDISSLLKRTIEEVFASVQVKGEVSGLKIAASGHIYFSLKDSNSVLNAICWRNTASRLPFELEEGMEIICSGSISTYPSRSTYQLIVEKIEIAGHGALLSMLEKRKQRLQIEGLFAAERKKALPFLPRVIGIITSTQGAVIRDILHRIRDRFPAHLLIWGVSVQGKEATAQIVQAINGFNSLPDNIPKPDLLIIARGGGSIEDLWTFNEEAIVRSVAASNIPVISAIGHETDITLIDLVADIRAPTPTAAAEMAVPTILTLFYNLKNLKQRLNTLLPNIIIHQEILLRQIFASLMMYVRKLQEINNSLQYKQTHLNFAIHNILKNKIHNFTYLISKYNAVPAKIIIQEYTQKLIYYRVRLKDTILQYLTKHENNLNILQKSINNYNHKQILNRGYAIIQDQNNCIITSISILRNKQKIHIIMQDGDTNAIVTDV